MLDGLRLRQVALVATNGVRVANELQQAFGWPEPFHDPGVNEFGLANSVFEVGDTFVEVLSPSVDGTSAGRYLQRQSGDCGYMAIFQVADLATARQRLVDLAIRSVWSIDLDDMATTHLHPKDLPGALVSLDSAKPSESWRWAGPRWERGAPATHAAGGISGITVATPHPLDGARRWAELLDLEIYEEGLDSASLILGEQSVQFIRSGDGQRTGIVAVSINALGGTPNNIGGVRFTNKEMP